MKYGQATIPWTVSWSGEDSFFIAPCPYAAGRPALCQPERPGDGRPLFAKPHSCRQRKAMFHRLCDICGRTLHAHTLVSMSQESPREVPGLGFFPLAVEPMVHRHCGAEALRHCPSLKRQQANGTLRIRQVFQFKLIAQLLNEAATKEFAGASASGAVGHLKLAIIKATDRDIKWLGAA
ncbi:MAG: hypothetical protein E6Q98_15765 [Rhodospirillaceae bacterium]|nr:MAG: hypothetical protein E6Q98_15765 [Rhodospirillaceae bacterium]